MKIIISFAILFLLSFPTATTAFAQAELEPGSPQLISPEDLLKLLQAPKGDKPLILNVGPHLIYMQAHIPGSEFIGPGSDSQALESLRRRVKNVPHNSFIILYCGCCPWGRCPNVRPAYNRVAQTRLHQRQSAVHR